MCWHQFWWLQMDSFDSRFWYTVQVRKGCEYSYFGGHAMKSLDRRFGTLDTLPTVQIWRGCDCSYFGAPSWIRLTGGLVHCADKEGV